MVPSDEYVPVPKKRQGPAAKVRAVTRALLLKNSKGRPAVRNTSNY